MRRITVVIVTESSILSCGLQQLLASFAQFHIDTVPLQPSETGNKVRQLSPAAVIADIADPRVAAEISELRDDSRLSTAFIGIHCSALPSSAMQLTDANFSIYDNAETVERILKRALPTDINEAPPTDLTPREKDVVVGIVKGLSNKEIAADINVSVNTVMTHRRNIASKLRIHSPAGLTIYAIVSKLVTIEEIKVQIPSISD